VEGPYAGVPLGAGAPLPPLEQPDQGDAVLSALLTSSTSPPASWRPAPGGRSAEGAHRGAAPVEGGCPAGRLRGWRGVRDKLEKLKGSRTNYKMEQRE